ncbi:helix-turn-helix transcriptional regulator [Candidatus Enterococcus ferrettii]|uniref:HTH araC/xylS-type domain-containing protein n=1 Tax=Candidatus Enterococcus ferrettii TaxID=2815324 RepID=A0ABV0EPU8_9ENTE|nr:AraC family transcriptional regulator [Enterococcus sp. 665A]MBO1341150.1 helix-turn-helix transcriptional regulator [Enterococcus sp. 665A]
MSKLITTIEQYVDEHLDQPISLESMAQQLHYSKHHLQHEFSAAANWSIYDYIKKRRLHEAAQCLLKSNRSIIAIALISGYQNQQSFTKVFKEIYKVSPSQFRRQKRTFGLVGASNRLLYQFPSKSIIRLARMEELSKLADYMEHIQWAFPYYEERSFYYTVNQRIKKGHVWVAVSRELITGLLIYDQANNRIDGLSSLPFLWDEDIEERLLKQLLALTIFDHKKLSTTTFRAKDKLDIGERQRLLNVGFTPHKELIEVGYPTELMVYKSR